MKIANANLQLTATHAASTEHEVRESLHAWVGQRGNANEAAPQGERVTLSEAGTALQAQEAAPAKSGDDLLESDPTLMLIRSLLEKMTGRKIRIFDGHKMASGSSGSATPPAVPPSAPAPAASGTPTPRPAGFGVEYSRHERYAESETTSFSASGTIKTADGQEIAFKLDLQMQRSFTMESDVSIRLGDAARQKDPLVINFGGNAAELTDARFAFDLDTDGTAEQINRLGAGSAFVALDRNGDGKINNGSELFGARTGDGFAELAELDDDKNGWIDEGDAAWKNLSAWTPDANGGGSLRSLSSLGVGAISLSHVATPFSLKDANNATQGTVRATGVYLTENGQVGTVQQVDLSV